MSLLQARHWTIMIGAVIMAIVAMTFASEVVPIYRITTYAFPIIAIAAILDTLGGIIERHRTPLKALAWICLVIAALVALAPLRNTFNEMQVTFHAWVAAGWPIWRSAWESLKVLGEYPTSHQQASAVALGLGLSVIAIALFAPLGPVFKFRIDSNRESRSGPWSAQWMDHRDIVQLVRNKAGVPLARYKGKLLRYRKNDANGWRGGHHLVISGTRGGKGVGAVIPAILDHQGPVVALDIKGENFAVTRRYRETLGRKVAVLNPFGLVQGLSDQFNPLDYIRSQELARDVNLIADGLVKPERGNDGHFSDMARQLIGAAIEVVVTQEEPDRRNLVSVADLLLSANLNATLNAWIDNSDLVGHRPAQVAATFLGTGDRERGSIKTSLSKAFQWMQSDSMRHFLTKSTFPIDSLLDDQVDLFIVVPLDQVSNQAVFMRLFINLVLGTVVRQDGRRRVKAPILLVLDEFVRMGRMEQVLNIANVAAGVGVEALFVSQDIGQVEEAYGRNDARSIFGSCISKRIFNVTDIETAEWASRHCGENTVYTQQVREAKTANESVDFSYSEQRRKVMTADQVLNMKADELLLLVGNRNPLKAKQIAYFKDAQYRGRFDENPLIQ